MLAYGDKAREPRQHVPVHRKDQKGQDAEEVLHDGTRGDGGHRIKDGQRHEGCAKAEVAGKRHLGTSVIRAGKEAARTQQQDDDKGDMP